jgi:hypothetical protein
VVDRNITGKCGIFSNISAKTKVFPEISPFVSKLVKEDMLMLAIFSPFVYVVGVEQIYNLINCSKEEKL